ncbi:hypothetical protein ACFFGV_06120 [Pontibacillus salicampi]|uniref:DUF2198 family protein n=1 Tax=Pontibacillus salicampi TaxID=1449801 RepID=A0ABV6LL86_9BACI
MIWVLTLNLLAILCIASKENKSVYTGVSFFIFFGSLYLYQLINKDPYFPNLLIAILGFVVYLTNLFRKYSWNNSS